jgi:hypothetical protein
MGERMNASQLKSRFVPALLAGTARLQISRDASDTSALDPLSALSLAGQALRFERPVAPENYTADLPIRDDRKLLPEVVRKPLLWLLRSRHTTNDFQLAIAWSFARLRLRPHPFDLPRMSGFVKVHAEHLGATALHWAHQDTGAKGPAPQPFYEQDEIDEKNWQSAPPAVRVRAITRLRKQDPLAGLTLLRAMWTSEDADMRVRLLEALQPEMNEADREFLEGLSKDRAPRVKALAERMIFRLNGFSGENAALREVLARIEQKTEGLLHKRVVLSLDVPATVKEHTLKAWVRDAFSELSCEELAHGLNLSETALVDASAKDPNLLLALALMAARDRKLPLLQKVLESLPDAWEQMAQCGPIDFTDISSDVRLAWATILARPYGSNPPFSLAAWTWMHRALRGPLPEDLMLAVLQSSTWQEKLQEAKGSEWTQLLAATCPPAAREKLRHMLGTNEPTQTVEALALLDILTAMEKS